MDKLYRVKYLTHPNCTMIPPLAPLTSFNEDTLFTKAYQFMEQHPHLIKGFRILPADSFDINLISNDLVKGSTINGPTTH